MRTFLALLGLLWLVGCVHTPKTGSLETLKPAAETFHQRIRWRDFHGAAELIVPERQEAYLLARRQQNDERDLTVSDYQLEDAKLSTNGLRATVTSRISWVRLPSASEHSDLVVSEFVYRDGTWWLARQDTGPFSPELAAPFLLDAPDAG
ncbi:MAG: hypothetical protein ACOZIN_15360 [Myxococcota bacterium]